MSIKYSLVNFDGTETLTVFHGGEAMVATDAHPNWAGILKGVEAGDPKAIDLFDITKAVARRFARLSTRITASDNRLYHDGDEVDNSLARKILEFIEAGLFEEKAEPLLKFMEKAYDNPEEHSRKQLFDWLERHDFSINEDGDILGYKAVNPRPVPGTNDLADHGHLYQSITSGANKVVVDGFEYTGNVPQSIGSVVEIPRSDVIFDPTEGCAAGLHVSNFRYANWFREHGRGTWNAVILLVAVNPRDVVSVPTESDWEKIRVRAYRVVRQEEVTDARIETVSPLWVERPEALGIGDAMIVNESRYYGREGNVHDLDGLVALGAKVTVIDTPENGFDCISDKNVLVRINADNSVYVAKDALVRDEEVDDYEDEDSWDSWYDVDDEDSWGY